MPLSLRQHRLLSTSFGCAAAYAAIFIVLHHTVKSNHLWRELMATPKSRTDLLALSVAYAVLSAALALLSGWKPIELPAKWFRISLVGITALALLGSAFMLVVIVFNLDWKMSL
ncbi:hypothetical protein [Luteolibacter soli]|uniref:Uncharacterized protein n=1 Tax=Luteolibacter soli TaxID=3135280 RepID=A0ABU9AQ64_9BACT